MSVLTARESLKNADLTTLLSQRAEQPPTFFPSPKGPDPVLQRPQQSPPRCLTPSWLGMCSSSWREHLCPHLLSGKIMLTLNTQPQSLTPWRLGQWTQWHLSAVPSGGSPLCSHRWTAAVPLCWSWSLCCAPGGHTACCSGDHLFCLHCLTQCLSLKCFEWMNEYKNFSY